MEAHRLSNQPFEPRTLETLAIFRYPAHDMSANGRFAGCVTVLFESLDHMLFKHCLVTVIRFRDAILNQPLAPLYTRLPPE